MRAALFKGHRDHVSQHSQHSLTHILLLDDHDEVGAAQDDNDEEAKYNSQLVSDQDVFFSLSSRPKSHRYGDDEEKEKTIMPRLTSDQDVFFSLSSRLNPQPIPFSETCTEKS